MWVEEFTKNGKRVSINSRRASCGDKVDELVLEDRLNF